MKIILENGMDNTKSNHDPRHRKEKYVQSWYPVSRSGDLKNGQHKPVKLFGLDWIIFRTISGKLSFLSRYCCHMGTDLCQGKVINENIECPFHAWQFDISGQLAFIPDYTKPLPNRRLHHLHCQEEYGLIFVFWGKKPLFPLPSFPDITQQQLFSAAWTHDWNINYLAFGLNAFDIQHYKHVHNRGFAKDPDIYSINPYALRMDSEVTLLKQQSWLDRIISKLHQGTMCIVTECWGGSMVTISNHDLNSCGLITAQPIDDDHTKVYLVSLTAYQDKPSLLNKLKLSISACLLQGFFKADIKPTKNMRLHQKGLLDDLDYGAKIYWSHFYRLPRF
jgi:nitrite reductase/ring-hydroxylating ferredoxin subunit